MLAAVDTNAVVMLPEEVRRTPDAPRSVATTPWVAVCALMAATATERLTAALFDVLRLIVVPLIVNWVVPALNTPLGFAV